ncbi:inositol monophosphatase 1 [Etheostoma spectabile]|uniref:inositol monophosphatase 1 n=1 Tax=Etheostoma spectabile TaxID=54343 RepID=UPI0013AFEBF9|nr:inositol monophosphatase 1 [Etheostoma spectabile]XP_032359714.1 inositol monophosphatase 1 [Etheostoma spectabile]XP_032359715.1 inositol monophosphatase 1 [Etheostoma spectabile]XP_032359716.1 inositol monophosphatase 1 [Etheostoma spectabile]XP_032359717.1 inositol monophosphatase 1 [Etheostoma spectabile]
MSDPWQECMDHCVEVTKKAGRMIREALQKDITVMHKSSPVDLVTETDQKVEQLIISSIKEKYPTHSFIGEESVAAGAPSVLTDSPTWIIDPIDGTTNFVHRFPFVSVSIGFTVKKEIEFGVVYSCIEDKMYTARKGNGAFCNGDPIKVSGQEDISQSLVLTEMGFRKNPEHFKTMLANIKTILTIPVHGIRSPGSAAVNMCLVACGSADAYYHMGIHCWDMAGGAAVVTEAGGVIMDISGGPFDVMSRRLIIASSRAIAERIAKEITEFHVGRDDTVGE